MKASYLGLGPREERACGEQLTVELADGRLPVLMLPKQGFKRVHASFCTQYGSMDTHFAAPTESAIQGTPAGVAHFLEHKMFEKEQGDVMHLFSQLGCSSNAMTSFKTTQYIMDCTDNVEASLALLVDFVLTPYFTQELVDKEQGIIAEEIRMYDDDPGWRGFMGLLKMLYPSSHPLTHDIAGTVESIQDIRAETLHSCHGAFYRPENMLLAVAGDMDPKRIMEIVEPLIAKRSQDQVGSPRRRAFPKSRRVRQKRQSLAMPVSANRFFMGWRCDLPTQDLGLTPLEKEAALDMYLGATLAKGGTVYQGLFEEGLIDGSFHHAAYVEEEFAFVIASGNTPDPARLRSRLKKAFHPQSGHRPDADSIRRQRRELYGSFVRSFDSMEAIGSNLIDCELKGTSLMDYGKVVDGLKLDSIMEAGRALLDPSASATFIVHPED